MNGWNLYIPFHTIALVLILWSGYLLTVWTIGPLKKAFVSAGLVRTNYQGQSIPVSMGSSLWFGILFASTLFLILSQPMELDKQMQTDIIALLVVSTCFLLVGLLDDIVGNREATGLRGHLRKFIVEREITTGMIKLVTGLISGLLGAFLLGEQGYRLLLGGLLIALSANSINLLDLRPGRACKGVLLFLAVLAVCSVRGFDSPVFWLLLAVTIAYFPEDLKARTMMGDAGSNLLGGGLGVLIVSTCTWQTILAWLGAFLLFHLYAEKYSLTQAIEKNKLLRWFDVLGRSA